MRKDVKIGLVLSFVFVVVAGLYYVGRDKTADPVKLDDAAAAADRTATPAAKGPVAAAPENKGTRIPTNNRINTPNKPVVPQPNPRVGPKPPASGSLTPPSESPGAAPRKTETTLATGPEAGNPTGVSPKAGASEAVASGSQANTPIENMFKFGADSATGSSPEPQAVKASDPASLKPGISSATDTGRAGAATSSTPPQPPPLATGRESTEPVRTHKVERGDSYSLLAEQYYGSQRYTQFLIDANPQYSDPTKLREGVTLKIPPRPSEASVSSGRTATTGNDARTPTASKTAVSGERIYVVKEDDTLYAIASRELGKGSRWPELLELNKETLRGSPERLRVGQSLKLPGGTKPDATKRP